ncbi:MAG: hypothetical protein EA412_00960 [Chitinophagaceae bacterium]|nr:MAG: hypothetical protein EA412_00960 [Chitinophagaceae bacterium]
MRATLILLLIVFKTVSFSHGQTNTNISGIVNDYKAVISLDVCANSMSVSDTSGLQAGDLVLIVQMKGASINLANNSNFGNFTNLNQAGKYEFNTISNINSGEVTFEYQFENEYSVNSKVQIIKVPQYQNVTITDTVTAMAWDGEKGGIVVIDASGSINIESVIDVNGKGFRGGAASNSNFTCSWVSPQTAYYYTLASGRAGRKGESIVNFNAVYECGRGPYGAGGGGGNDHNTGGGGGSHVGLGGDGGKRLVPSQFFCNGENRGLGGNTVVYNQFERLIMGSGGGAGHMNDSLGSGGANGGGIIILRATEINSQNGVLTANGANAKAGSYDGTGGGGAGGSVVLAASSINNPLLIQTNGGNGGNVSDDLSNTCYGPGGGGGGGFLGLTLNSIPSNITYETFGGNAGLKIAASSTCNTGNGTEVEDGLPGGFLEGISILTASDLFIPPVFSISSDTLICPGDTITLSAGGGGLYLWEPQSSLSCNDCPQTSAFPGQTETYTLTILNGLCEYTDSVTVEVIQMPQLSISPENVFLCTDTNITISVSGAPNNNYTWTGGDLQSPQIGNEISVNPSETQVYTVEWTDSLSFCTVSKTSEIFIEDENFATFPEDISICDGSSVQLIATGGTNYSWSPSTGLSCQNCPNPIVTVDTNTTYEIIVSNDFGCRDTSEVTVSVDDTVFFFSPDSVSICKNSSQTIFLQGNGTFEWSPSSFLSCTDCNNPEVSPDSSLNYTVTLTNGACSHTETIFVEAKEFPDFTIPYDTIDIEFNESFEIDISLLPVEYSISWSPEFGIDDSSTANPIITGIESQEYTFTVTLDSTGCTTTQTIYINVITSEETYDIFPNAFNPTGGGMNSRFGPFDPGPGHEFDSFQIFNRWGVKVFEGFSFADGWDGKLKGELQPMDTYVYQLTFYDRGNKMQTIRGSVILIR